MADANRKSYKSGHVSPEDKEIFNVGRYWRAVVEYRWGILVLVTIAICIGFVWMRQVVPWYQATATLLIEVSQPQVIGIQDLYRMEKDNKEYIQTQHELLRARSLAERVVSELQLDQLPEFDPMQQDAFEWRDWISVDWLESVWPFDQSLLEELREKPQPLSPQARFKAAVGLFMSRLVVEPVRNTQLVKIRFESRSPERAAKIANSVASQFIASQLESKIEVTEKASTWLGESLDGLREKLRESEKRLQEFRESEKLVDVRGVKTLNAEELSKLTERSVDARRARMEAGNLYNRIVMHGTPPPEYHLLGIPEIINSPAVSAAKLKKSEVQSRVNELSKRYGPKHPKMIAALSDLQSVSNELNMQLHRAAQAIESSFRIAEENERAINRQLQQAKASMQSVNRVEFRLRELEREVDSNRKLYDLFLSRAKETNQATGLQDAPARVVDSAIPPAFPYKPKKAMILAMLAAIGFGLGVIRALVKDALNRTVRSAADVEDKLKVPALGVLPSIVRKRSIKRSPIDNLFFDESIQSLRTSLMLTGESHNNQLILITSSVPGEGKTMVALKLAKAFAQSEKVLLLEADLRQPTLGGLTGVQRMAPGLADVIAGKADLKDSLQTVDPDSGLELLTAGSPPPGNPQEVLAGRRFKVMLNILLERYDHIIIDSGPVLPVSDSLVLAKLADTVICIVKAEHTAVSLVHKGLKKLRSVGANISGVVLNQVDISKRKEQFDYMSYPSYLNMMREVAPPERDKLRKRSVPENV